MLISLHSSTYNTTNTNNTNNNDTNNTNSINNTNNNNNNNNNHTTNNNNNTTNTNNKDNNKTNNNNKHINNTSTTNTTNKQRDSQPASQPDRLRRSIPRWATSESTGLRNHKDLQPKSKHVHSLSNALPGRLQIYGFWISSASLRRENGLVSAQGPRSTYAKAYL
jgi:hypothetical protein